MSPAAHPKRPSARRSELLAGLVEIFLAEGFGGFSLEDLAVRLQCSKSTLYGVAPSKEQLITAVVRAFFRRATERVEARLAAETDPVRRISVYLEAIAGELAPASAAFYADLDSFDPAHEIYSRNTVLAARRVRDLVADAEQPGRPVDAVFIGAVAAKAMESIQQGELRSLTSLDDAMAYRALADLIVAGVARLAEIPVRQTRVMPDYRARAAAAADVLQRWYSPRTGLWRGTGWWNSANALTAVIRYMRDTGDQSYAGVIETTFLGAQQRHAGFINTFYDDNGWWGLAWLAAYDLADDRRYLAAAEAVFAHNRSGWDAACGGGLWWNEQRGYKNAITSELFLLLAALLQQRSPGHPEYLDWALRTWQWLDGSGLIGPDGLVSDGLTDDCVNNQGTTWTYNQGVILGGLSALHDITGEAGYLRRAEDIADAALRRLTSPAGILTEPNEADGCDGDQTQFKGIFARYLRDLPDREGRPRYRTFLLANADAVWDRARNPAGQLGCRWEGPFDQADASRQSSALEVLTAAAAVTG
jgi:predicted alpha-1,6-mannanase (GH76 family)